ncbi:hypothetical protein JRQ81_001365 [Phrynocephalus forsythii]|uniref:Uncharacterized protein n=1 Tax=Phrynocephalus forsythii TaxID=171643 RepID=A0A9Q0Y729_9SAUR|nr:hypothetical protein JRQ81_001365 [Phrynocephalus forsythii]
METHSEASMPSTSSKSKSSNKGKTMEKRKNKHLQPAPIPEKRSKDLTSDVRTTVANAETTRARFIRVAQHRGGSELRADSVFVPRVSATYSPNLLPEPNDSPGEDAPLPRYQESTPLLHFQDSSCEKNPQALHQDL